MLWYCLPCLLLFVVVYNGNLGKDYAYPGANPTVREYTFVGDVVIVNGNTYINAKTTNRTDVLAVDFYDYVNQRQKTKTNIGIVILEIK